MIIKNLLLREKSREHCLSADVLYEDYSKEKTEVVFEIPKELKTYLRPSYEAFLFALYPAALYRHEKRIKIEGEICLETVMNVTAALHLQKQWYEQGIQIPIIEFKKEVVQYPAENGTAGCFLSGGVDSLALFHRNMTVYPQNHRKRFKSAICAFGLDMGDPNQPAREDIYTQTIHLLKKLTSRYNCELIPVYTNARDLEKNWLFYEQRQFGSLLTGIAHSLGNRLKNCAIALDNRIDFYCPHGSHPLLNKYFSSSYLEIESVMDAYLRIEKYKFFKDVPEALNILRVCYNIQNVTSDLINCGHCAKCTRTKLELLINGILDRAATFPDKDIPLDDVRKMKIRKYWHREFHGELITPLRELGYSQMADILQKEWDNSRVRPSWIKRSVPRIKTVSQLFRKEKQKDR